MPKKIAVIGGGLSAVTAVYNLVKDPDWKNKYDITIYQHGWRLGGKGASGVNPEIGYRVEEHGLHLWMGFYENAFSMMREVYKELDRKPTQPLATFHEAFKGQPFMVFEENVRGTWVNWQINFPHLAGFVGDGKPVTWYDLLINIERFLTEGLDKTLDLHHNKKNSLTNDNYKGIIPDFFHNLIHDIEKGIEGVAVSVSKKLFSVIFKLLVDIEKFESYEHHLTLLSNFKKWIWDTIGELVDGNDALRRLWTTTDLMIAILSGMIVDKVIKIDDGIKLDFNAINQYDYAEWLVMHGADMDLTIPSPLVKSMYDGPFAFKNGDILQGNAEAGTMLNIFFRLAFTCKENVVWRMQAGMGDTIFSPIYELLVKEEKAKFKFFHTATDLQLSNDKKNVEKIILNKQIKLNGEENNLTDNYYPLLNVNGLDCWPSHPLYGQIDPAQAKQLIDQNINLESDWANWNYKEEIILTKGIDFDEIIIGASLASLPHFASQLIDNNVAWQSMLANVGTVQTQAFQMWLNKDSSYLGVLEDELLSCYVEPLDTYTAMNQILKREKWPKDEAKFLSYTCGAFPDAINILPFNNHVFPNTQNEQVKQNMLYYIKNNLQHILPNAFDEEGNFDWDLLVDLENRTGEDRINSQYIRANIDSSERYVLSLKGSSQYRLKTNESGYDNLYLTGDWIQNGMNAGFVEGAVTSGLLTAQAISGNNTIKIVTPEWDNNNL